MDFDVKKEFETILKKVILDQMSAGRIQIWANDSGLFNIHSYYF